jgi:hypothetical protein
VLSRRQGMQRVRCDGPVIGTLAADDEACYRTQCGVLMKNYVLAQSFLGMPLCCVLGRCLTCVRLLGPT